MNSYLQVNLKEMLNEIGEEETNNILSDFYSKTHDDIEIFLREKAIIFANQGLAATHLVFTNHKEKMLLIGYFALANKTMGFHKSGMSKSLSKRVSKFAKYDNTLKKHLMSTILIGQLGKNYNNGQNKLITGDELLEMACNKVVDVQLQIGGKVVYLECEDTPHLLTFYDRNGFVNFGKRPLEGDETGLDGEYLVQMLKYLKT